MHKTITLNFANFWSNFDKTHNVFTHLLRKYYGILITEEPEFLIYSVFGDDDKKYSDAVKIWYAGENILPNFSECDYALSYSYIKSPRHYRLPLYYFYCYSQYISPDKKRDINTEFRFEPPLLTGNKRNINTDTLKSKSGFCSFVVSNPDCEFRNNFFKKLSTYKKVSSGGRYLNNVGGPVHDKTAFLKKHKFNIAFENSSTLGYTTEKVLEAYLGETIPIYWGNKLVGRDFNKKALICVHDFKNIDAVIDKIVEIDNDDEQLLDILNQPLFENNLLNKYIKEENIIKFFDFIFKNGRTNKSWILDFLETNYGAPDS